MGADGWNLAKSRRSEKQNKPLGTKSRQNRHLHRMSSQLHRPAPSRRCATLPAARSSDLPQILALRQHSEKQARKNKRARRRGSGCRAVGVSRLRHGRANRGEGGRKTRRAAGVGDPTLARKHRGCARQRNHRIVARDEKGEKKKKKTRKHTRGTEGVREVDIRSGRQRSDDGQNFAGGKRRRKKKSRRGASWCGLTVT